MHAIAQTAAGSGNRLVHNLKVLVYDFVLTIRLSFTRCPTSTCSPRSLGWHYALGYQ